MDGLPVITIEMQGISYHVRQAFVDHMEELKRYAENVISASFNELEKGGLEKAIIASVERTMDEAINQGIKDAVDEAVGDYFSTGAGKDFIANAIARQLARK